MIRWTCLLLLVVNLLAVTADADDVARQRSAVKQFLERQFSDGAIVGAQIVIGNADAPSTRSIHVGQIEPGDPRPVSAKTLFGIGSCSKPVASAVVFRLLDQRMMRLSDPVSQYLPVFGLMQTRNGKRVRSPTIAELLTHRSGIYSQHVNITAEQTKAIRDFTLTLDESIEIIARQPLATPPAEAYAYSGAGYCVLGSVAEKATGRSFEELLQTAICEPLQMRSTTYFPDPSQFGEIACGGAGPRLRGADGARLPSPAAPHKQGDRLRLPLIGGSLYTTAADMQRFARMIIAKGVGHRQRVLSAEAWRKLTSQPYPDQRYGFGWLLTRAGGQTIVVSHNGSLSTYQSLLSIHLPQKRYVIIHWTLSDPTDAKTTKRIRGELIRMTS